VLLDTGLGVGQARYSGRCFQGQMVMLFGSMGHCVHQLLYELCFKTQVFSGTTGAFWCHKHRCFLSQRDLQCSSC
jgi:hypothetical protein